MAPVVCINKIQVLETACIERIRGYCLQRRRRIIDNGGLGRAVKSMFTFLTKQNKTKRKHIKPERHMGSMLCCFDVSFRQNSNKTDEKNQKQTPQNQTELLPYPLTMLLWIPQNILCRNFLTLQRLLANFYWASSRDQLRHKIYIFFNSLFTNLGNFFLPTQTISFNIC